MTARRGLGRGLDALLSSTARTGPADDETGEAVLDEVDVNSLAPNPEQPRTGFDETELNELADSIRVHGLLQPVIVEGDGHGGYRLIAGERRVRAARIAGLTSVPAIIRPAAESSRQSLELALIENLQRSDLGAIEEATAFQRLADAFGLSHEAIGMRVGRSRAAVANAVRLLQLPAPVQAALAERRLSAGHARALLALPSQTAQERLAARIASEHLSVRAAERAVQAELDERPRREAADPERPTAGPATASPGSADDMALARGLEEALGTPVRLERRRRGGRLVIDFYDDAQLDELYGRLGGRSL